jgi:hypothetical protein
MASLLGSAAGGEGQAEKPANLSKRELEEWAEIFRRRGGAASEDDAD